MSCNVVPGGITGSTVRSRVDKPVNFFKLCGKTGNRVNSVSPIFNSFRFGGNVGNRVRPLLSEQSSISRVDGSVGNVLMLFLQEQFNTFRDGGKGGNFVSKLLLQSNVTSVDGNVGNSVKSFLEQINTFRAGGKVGNVFNPSKSTFKYLTNGMHSRLTIKSLFLNVTRIARCWMAVSTSDVLLIKCSKLS